MVKVKVKQSLYSRAGSGVEGVKVPRFQDRRHMQVVRFSDLPISRRSAYGETTFRHLKSALKKLMMMMMMVVVVLIIIIIIIIITLTVVLVRIAELPFDPHFLKAVCSSLPTLVTKTVFQSLHCRFTFRAYNSMFIFVYSVYGNENKNK